jgi:uncharacterized protein
LGKGECVDDLFQNPDDATLRTLLMRVRSIAVVGLSPRPDRASHGVSRHLQRFGYTIVPVRPGIDRLLGETAYPDLRDVPAPIDLVDVFRAPQHVDGIVDACIEQRLPAIWLQLGVINDAAARRARAAGLVVVMDRCLYLEYLRLFGAKPIADVSAPATTR